MACRLLCLCLALSPCICIPLFLHSSRLLSPSHWPSYLNRIDEQIIWEKARQKVNTLKQKRNFCWQENKVKSNLSSWLSLDSGWLFLWCAIFPSTPITFFLYLISLVAALSLFKVYTTWIRNAGHTIVENEDDCMCLSVTILFLSIPQVFHFPLDVSASGNL